MWHVEQQHTESNTLISIRQENLLEQCSDVLLSVNTQQSQSGSVTEYIYSGNVPKYNLKLL